MSGEPIYHIIERSEWDRAKAGLVYRPASLEPDGFIHCSTRSQVIGVANHLYRGRTDLLLLEIDPDRVAADIVYEDLYNAGQDYPHIYGTLNLDAVVSVHVFEPKPNGSFELPPGV